MTANVALQHAEPLADANSNEALLEGNLQVLNDLIAGVDRLKGQTFTDLPGDHSSPIGMHVRHVIEFYQAFFKSLDADCVSGVCYDNRKRNLDFETSKVLAREALQKIVNALKSSDLTDRDVELSVVIDPVQPLSILRTSVHRELYHVLDHTIHHMAIIKMLAAGHGVAFDENFGLANATKKDRQKSAKA